MKTQHLRTGSRNRITWQKKRVWVTIIVSIEGRDLVAVDKEGFVYTTWWDERASEVKGRRPLQFRHWRRYNSLYHLRRGLAYALVDAKKVKIPTLADLQEFCQNKRASIAILEGNVEPQLQRMAKEFTRLQDFLRYRKRRPLRESEEQLSFILLLRDKLGRINIGVLRARLTAIDARFTQELKHLLGWMPHYAARISAISGIQAQMQRTCASLRRSVGAMASSSAVKAGKASEGQVTGMKEVLRQQIADLEVLGEIRPFTHWAKHCLGDLAMVHCCLDSRDFDNAHVYLDRLRESMKLRVLGFWLEELIREVGLGIKHPRPNGQSYQGQIRKLLARFEGIKEKETGFRNPVCEEIGQHLSRALREIRDRRWLELKFALKDAAALI